MNGMIVPARLKYATSQSFDIAGLPDEYTHLRAKVENIAFAKDVEVHYRQPDGTCLGRHDRALPVDVSDRDRANQSTDTLRDVAARLEIDE